MGIAGAGNSGTVLTTLAAPRLAEQRRLARGLRPRADPGRARVGRVRAARQGAARARRPGPPARPAHASLRERDAWRLCGLYAVTFGAFVGLASFLPIFFRDQYGISKVDAATIVAVGAALGSLLRPARRLPRRPRRRHDGADRRLRRRRGAAAVRLRAARARRRRGRVLPRHGRRSGSATAPSSSSSACATASGSASLTGHRRRGRRPRRVLPADHPRHGPGRVRLLRAGHRRDRRRRGRRAGAARWSCAGPGSPRPERGHEDARHRRRDRRPGRARGDPRARPRHELTLVCAEPRLPYDRVALSTLLASGADPDTLTLRPRAGTRTSAIEVPPRTTRVETLDTDAYDRVVLCTGSDALVPPIPGAQHAHVFRGPEDCAAIAGPRRQRAVVIGGGLLGLEAAYGLAALGCESTVVHLMDRLMERQLDDGAATLLAPAMEALGVEVLLERNTEEITARRRPARRRRVRSPPTWSSSRSASARRSTLARAVGPATSSAGSSSTTRW